MLTHRDEVGAGGELLAGTGDDDNPYRWIALPLLEQREQVPDEFDDDPVSAIGPVERHHRHARRRALPVQGLQVHALAELAHTLTPPAI